MGNEPVETHERPAQHQLAIMDRRDRMVRIAELGIMLIVIGFNIFQSIRLQTIINQNQQNTLEARQQNVDRQNQMTGYIKCILLLRYDHPELTPTSTRDEVARALDQCSETADDK